MFFWRCTRTLQLLLLVFFLVNGEELPENQPLSSCELEKILRPLFSSPTGHTFMAQALQRQLYHKIEQRLREQADKNVDKKSLESLVRAGYLKKIQNSNNPNDSYPKRSIQSLMRTGQVPQHSTTPKRSIESLARNGELIVPNKSEEQNFEDLSKRNTENEKFYYPTYARSYDSEGFDRNEDNGYKNLESLDRNDLIPNKLGYFSGDNGIPAYDGFDDKRNLASVKALNSYQYKRSDFEKENDVNNRGKRLADYYEDNKQYTNLDDDNVADYDGLIQELNDIYYPAEGKRFLGSIVQNNWPSSLARYRSPDKRHIGSLARLGWLPAFRNIRRFNRSGRSTSDGVCPPCERKTSPNGKAKDYNFSKNSLSLNGKRFLLIPAVDNVLLRRYSTNKSRN